MAFFACLTRRGCFVIMRARGMSVRILADLDDAHFEQMAQLERLYYGEEFITPPQEAYSWYVRFPYTVVAAADADKVVGFVNLFPVKSFIYEALRAGRFNDHFLTSDGVEDIRTAADTPLHMFLCCIVVHAAYRAQGLTRLLLQQAVAQYAPVRHRCTEVVTDNVTAAGERFSRRYGFRLLCQSNHDSAVYAQTWQDFEQAVLSPV
ncbi:MAG: GNAT family N-acetyltransferase [Akkermansiaceae bacterium]|nr:GNAT family N-acetyltransferase [Akkermansiaceae bacterium]